MSGLWRPGVIIRARSVTPGIAEAIKAALTPTQTVALTAWAEARSRLEPRKGWVSNPLDAMANVVNVIDNRTKDKRWSHLGHKGVCLARRQFSCWDTLGGLENYFSLLDRAQQLLAGQEPSDKLSGCLALATSYVELKSGVDALDRATHYYAPASMLPVGMVPLWSMPPAKLVVEAHGHRFFNCVR